MPSDRMKPRNIEAIYRLTPLQEGLLFHTLEDPDSSAYFDQYSAVVNGALDIDMLQRAWQELVAQHAVLRTFFTWEKREHPLQVVRATVELPFDAVDLRRLDEQARQQALEDYLQQDRQRGFALDQAPLIRVRLSRLDDTKYHMAWSFHHLVLDGWSVRLLLTELQHRYAALLRGERFSAPVAPTFEAYVGWQRQSDADAAQRFWSAYLTGFRLPTTPRFAGSAPSIEQDTARHTRLVLAADLHEKLNAFARESRVTLNTLFVAAWGLVLGRYCDCDDVVFGATTAGRPATIPNIERTAGLFITTLPVRVTVESGDSVSKWLGALQKDQTSQREYDFVGLNVIQKASEVPAGLPLFETLLVFENFPAFTAAEDQAFVLEQEDFREYSHYPLALLVVPGKTLELIVVHRPDRYSTADVERMLENVVTALGEIMMCENVADIDVLSPNQRDRLIEAGRGPTMPLTPNSVLEAFEHQASTTPNAIAVAVGNSQFSYADIDARASRLAFELHGGEFRDASAAVIVCERNEAALIAMLAAQKAGIVYVTLDAKDPVSRVDYVLDDMARAFGSAQGVGSPVLMTTRKVTAAAVAPSAKHRLLLVDEHATEAVSACAVDRGSDDPDAPAYVIYTSGSTGRPKGVLVSHRSLANSTFARLEFYPTRPAAFALLSSLATDSSIAGVYWTLCTGGTLVMPAERAELDVTAMLELFVRRAVTHTLCVPSLYALMLDAIDATPCPSLQTVIVAGEACPLSLVKRHYSVLEDVNLYNEYGPSEACVWVTAALLKAADDAVTIGRPIMNTRTLVLDRARRLAPAGVPGELYVGGSNLAREYINHAESTASSFITLSMPDAERFYRTGDKVVFNQNNQLEYLGRIDNQLKIRGFRVEPEEVEAALCLDERIDSAIVLIDESDVQAAITDALAVAGDTQASLIEQTLDDIEKLSDEEAALALNALANLSGARSND